MKKEVKKFFIISIAGYAILAALTAILAPNLQRFYPLPPDQGPSWYFWQIASPETLAIISYIGGYILHQIFVWAILFKVIKDKEKKFSKYNKIMIIGNLIFTALHLLQTQLFYAGLAQDVAIWTSQGSVIVMLVFILYMLIPRRGLFWGKKFAPPETMRKFIEKIHGVFISWAIVYTFWFHPMDGNWGLMSGFIYLFLLFIQLSMFNSELHFNMNWIVLLEAFVTVHGTLITVYKSNPIWPMFLFGFMTMFIFTQMHGLKISKIVKFVFLSAYIISIGLVYGLIRGFEHIYEIFFIPVALYGGVIALLGIGKLIEIGNKKKTN